MESTKKWKKRSFSTILWSVMVVLMCVTPSLAYDVYGTLNFGTGKDVEMITSDFVDVYGTLGILNMYAGAYNDWGIYAYPGALVGTSGGTINIYGCAPGNTLWVLEPDLVLWPGLPPVVTVYGPKFRIGIIEYTPDTDMLISGLLEVLSDTGDLLFSLTINSDIDIYLRALGSGGPKIVQIDIKPGSDPNPINPGSKGLIPVAILTTEDFDAADVDPATVTLAGANVAVRGKTDKLMARLEDVDGDGDLDLLLQIDTQSEDAAWENGEVILTGKTYQELGAEDIQGSDYVVIVPPKE